MAIPNAKAIRLRLPFKALVVALALLLTGCGGDKLATYPVEGRVVYADGESLSGGTINFETEMGKLADGRPHLVYATGEIAVDGMFQLITNRSQEGAVAGRHRVAIGKPLVTGSDFDNLRSSQKRTVRQNYANYDTSGLEVTIEPKANEITITIERP